MAALGTLDARSFDWERLGEHACGSAEASELGLGVALPVVLSVWSPRTHSTREFELVKTSRNAEGEIECWCYDCVTNRGITLVIWND